MNLPELRKNWDAIKEKVKQRYVDLTDEDLSELFWRLQSRTQDETDPVIKTQTDKFFKSYGL